MPHSTNPEGRFYKARIHPYRQPVLLDNNMRGCFIFHGWKALHSREEGSLACSFSPSLRAPVPAAKRRRHPASSPDVLCLFCCPCGCAVPFQLCRSTLLVCVMPRRCKLGHQLVLRTGTHPLHLNLQGHKSRAMIKIIDTNNAVLLKHSDKKYLNFVLFGFTCSEPKHL